MTISIIQIDNDKEQYTQFIINKDGKFFQKNDVPYEAHDVARGNMSKASIFSSLVVAGITTVFTHLPFNQNSNVIGPALQSIKAEMLSKTNEKFIIAQLRFDNSDEYIYLLKKGHTFKTHYSKLELWNDKTITDLFDFEYHYSLAASTTLPS